jgi:hypothetical protein
MLSWSLDTSLLYRPKGYGDSGEPQHHRSVATAAETWVFSSAGELWEVEHGPRGGDELNLIEKGKNDVWPLVSIGNNYNGVPIPNLTCGRAGDGGALLGADDRAGQFDVLQRHPDLPAMERQRIRQRHGDPVAQPHRL